MEMVHSTRQPPRAILVDDVRRPQAFAPGRIARGPGFAAAREVAGVEGLAVEEAALRPGDGRGSRGSARSVSRGRRISPAGARRRPGRHGRSR
ncbi:MAG: hypothetical protein M0C28_26895 [Candidatus Moduliflexus flocculans]|nr:hypothetical protein [Candidatus Moduliflexus flocculans]